jgi:cytochrome c-type biogenesis protein CcmE
MLPSENLPLEMMVKPKNKRLSLLVVVSIILVAAVGLMLVAFEDNLIFFNTPTDIVEKEIEADRRFRLGGLVEEESVRRDDDGLTTRFRVTDLTHTVEVSFRGILPDLFREGQGVVAEGKLNAAGVFIASEVLAKHDENYIPENVAEALKKSGQWRGAGE